MRTIEALLTWWDAHPSAYLVTAQASLLLLLGWLIWELWRESIRQKPPSAVSEWLYFGGLLLLTVAWRWPYLLVVSNFNPDESQLIAGAITLLQKPIFWKYVDGHTAGPVDYYILTLPGLVGLPLSFFVERAYALLMMVGAGWLSYKTLSCFAPARVARLGVLPPVVFIATTRDWDFLAVTSEHTPVFLLSAASCLALLAFRRERQSGTRRGGYWILAGLANGLTPWAKLQAAPVAALLAIVIAGWIVFEKRFTPKEKTKYVIWFVGATAFPTLGFVTMILGVGEWDTFYGSYISSNLSYISAGASVGTSIAQMLEATGLFNIFQAFLASCAASLVIFTGLYTMRRRRIPGSTLACAAAVVVAFIIIVIPKRGFPHYLLFSIFPLGLAVAAAFSAWWKIIADHVQERRLSLVIFCVAGILPVVIVATIHGPAFPLGGLIEYRQNPYSPLTAVLRPWLRKNDTVAMWGWFPQLYVELQAPQATREAHTQRQIEPSALRRSFRARYMADLTAGYPIAVVDAVGPAAFGYHDRAKTGHETFPALSRYIADNFTLVADLPEGRVYIRNSRRQAPQR